MRAEGRCAYHVQPISLNLSRRPTSQNWPPCRLGHAARVHETSSSEGILGRAISVFRHGRRPVHLGALGLVRAGWDRQARRVAARVSASRIRGRRWATHVIEAARHTVARSVNAVMTTTYWLVGRRIVEQERQGVARAAYGEQLLKRLSRDLSKSLVADSPSATSSRCAGFISAGPFRRQRLRNRSTPPAPPSHASRCHGLTT